MSDTTSDHCFYDGCDHCEWVGCTCTCHANQQFSHFYGWQNTDDDWFEDNPAWEWSA